MAARKTDDTQVAEEEVKTAATESATSQPEGTEEGNPAEATTTVATSGATVEPAVVEALPMEHPAVDSEPRKGLPPESSRIDFNDPSY